MLVEDRYENNLICKYYSKEAGIFKPSYLGKVGKTYPFVEETLNRLIKGRVDTKIVVFEHLQKENWFSIVLHTEKHEYYIRVDNKYVCCEASNRYYEPLEDWTRGRDLRDGECNRENFEDILFAILYNELLCVNTKESFPVKINISTEETDALNKDNKESVE